MPPLLSPLRSWLGLLVAIAFLALSVLSTPARGTSNQKEAAPKSQVDAYAAQVPKTIVELQQFRYTHDRN